MTSTTSSPTTVLPRRSHPADPRALRLMALGAVCGLAWAAGFRGWMGQLAWGDQGSSSVTWLTMPLVLLPGLAIGVLYGRAAYHRRSGRRHSRWLVWAPVLFASALLDPNIFLALFRDGTGGGALMVVATALAGGFVLSRRRWSVGRVLCVLPSVVGLLLIGLMGGVAGPLTSPRGAWVSLFGLVFTLLFCLASVLPYAPVRARLGAWPLVTIGALCGLAWACALRSFMTEIVGADSGVTWEGTFAWILAPGVVAGALLGWAEHLRRTGGRHHWRWLAAAPLVFAAVLFSRPLQILDFFEDGIGGGALGIPLLCMAGGYAVSGRGPLWARLTCGAVAAAGFASWAITGPLVGGPELAVTEPRGLWVALLLWSLEVLLALASAIPHRPVVESETPT